MKRLWPIILLLGCAAAFLIGLDQLFRLRFEVGDVYPPYSSLRTDPLGTMAIYESLQKLPGMAARRDFSDSNRLPEARDTVYFHLGARTYEWNWLAEDSFKDIQQFLLRGGRLVITLFPQPAAYPSQRNRHAEMSPPADDEDPRHREDQSDQTPRSKKRMRKDRHEEALDSNYVSLKEKWGVDFTTVNLEQGDKNVYQPVSVTNQIGAPLPAELNWHSGVVFTNLDSAWRTVYARGSDAVVIERRFGEGAVVVATDSFFLSNEAMDRDRRSELLAWLVGPGKTVVFDEAHLGVVESSGVAQLMRKYRLHGFAAGLVLLAALFIWKNSLSLLPPHPSDRRQEFVAGKDAAAGFINLLRRSIAPRAVLETCFTEWRATAPQSGSYSAARIQEADAAFQAWKSLPPKQRNSVHAYRIISSILAAKK